jgi:hypothetical protein
MTILLTLSQLEITGAEVYAIEIAEKLIDRGAYLFYNVGYIEFKNEGKIYTSKFQQEKTLE